MIIRPKPGGGRTHARALYNSIHGPIITDWNVAGERLQLAVTIPANTTATVHLPTDHPQRVTESGQAAAQADSVRFIGANNGDAVYKIGSGEYRFECPARLVSGVPD